jgi:hypothetical protein
MNVQPKPPLGIMPRYLWIEKRIQDLAEAIGRYIESPFPIPTEWVDERNQLLMELDILLKRKGRD